MDLKIWFGRAATLTMLFGAILYVPAQAQVVPSAFGPEKSLWAGAEYSNISASFPYQSGQRIEGEGVFVDLHLKYPFGLEGEARFLNFGGFEGSTESSFLAGPKVFFLSKERVHPYGKLLVGVGRIHYPFAIGEASYFALTPGTGIEYNVNRRWTLRAGYEYQMWLNSPGYANEPNHELTPNGFDVGIACRIFR